ncbi:hypothetical protein DPMN_066596 [Dreissena polymorpha]|uniref:Uncharacterized protein n=1 Tax=Dreissena polymorpha TaxID=45954 RepID=A0A9D3YWL6_DREPO|nr:hypothetical protein DPMN_066596 [Dreissena polymorpha]
MFGQEKASHNFIETSRETQTSDSWSAANISVRLDHSTVKTRTALKWISCDVCKRWLHEIALCVMGALGLVMGPCIFQGSSANSIVSDCTDRQTGGTFKYI